MAMTPGQTLGMGANVGSGQKDAIDAAKKKDNSMTQGMGVGINALNTPDSDKIGNSWQQQQAATIGKTTGMGANVGVGQKQAIKDGQEATQAMQGQGVTAVGPQKGADGKIHTGFGTTQDEAVNRGIAAQAEEIKRQRGVNEQMTLTSPQQQAGLSQSIDLMGQRSAKATEMEYPSAPVDYNAVYNTEAEIFNQKQASDWNNRMDFMAQRAKERGMEGTDLSAYLSHMELGNRMGLLDARQSIMLEGLQKDMAFKEKDYWQTRSEDTNMYMDLLNASWGDEEAVRGILEMAAGALGEDSYFGNLLKNPDMLRNLNDAGYNEKFQLRNQAASNVLREMTSPTDIAEVNATFSSYKNAKYGSGFDINVPSDLSLEDLDPEIYADYAEAFGAIDWENPSADDIKNVYAYQKYREDVEKTLYDEVAVGLVNEFLTNGGNPETAEKIRELDSTFVFSLMEDDAMANYIGGQVNADDLIDGPLSFLFSDWEGNVYEDQNAYLNRSPETKALDLKFQDYMKTAVKNGDTPISRSEYLDAVLEVTKDRPGEIINMANASDINSRVNSYLGEVEASNVVATATDAWGNPIDYDNDTLSYNGDTKEFSFDIAPSEMNNTQRVEAAIALPKDSAQFLELVSAMDDREYSIFIENLTERQYTELKDNGYATTTIDSDDTQSSYSEDKKVYTSDAQKFMDRNEEKITNPVRDYFGF